MHNTVQIFTYSLTFLLAMEILIVNICYTLRRKKVPWHSVNEVNVSVSKSIIQEKINLKNFVKT